MKAKALFREKMMTKDGDIIEKVIWAVPRGSLFPEGVRYRLAFIPQAAAGPAVLYDNHHPKGHHRHWEGKEEPFDFLDVNELREAFERDVSRWKKLRRPS